MGKKSRTIIEQEEFFATSEEEKLSFSNSLMERISEMDKSQDIYSDYSEKTQTFLNLGIRHPMKTIAKIDSMIKIVKKKE